ncbi:hypothetical protein [Singulisphaera acidiphila]|uniref:Uncharacterized protein n=1 Tax=Singulisphaera acidiphila (strain ATCC BAA-1392 / DSM 18658 / VKM B-2454 / MOB10) TaxID=886293 RepID=L0DGW2_SINAD|nr:hypothetical protein [Singulisphaera acidiphila]AGA28619.1 hypothetical protein Sinac_4430 [Singulisphaera acidiphila DSM 18658]
MDSMLRRLIATWIKSQELAPRRDLAAAVRCESLEGRQLLSTTTLLRGHMGMPSAPTTQYGQLSTTRGTMVGQNVRGFGGGAASSSAFTQTGQPGNFRGHSYALAGGVGRGGLSARNSQAVRPSWQNLPNTTATATPNTTAITTPATLTATPDASDTTSAVSTVVATDSTGVPPEALATDATTLPANSADGTMAPVQLARTLPAMGGGSFNAMPSGPMGGWFGGQAGNREPVSFRGALGQPTNVTGAQGGNTSTITKTGPSEAVKQGFEKLQTDLQAIQDKSEVTPKLLAAVRNDFDAIQKAATTDPDQDALKALNATVESLDGQIPTDAQQAQLVADFTAVLKSQGVTDQTLIDTAVADIQAVVAASHVTSDDLATIAADREAITKEMNADAGETTSAIASTDDVVGSLFAGLTGGFDSGAPMAGLFAGDMPGGPVNAFPVAFSSAGGVMMDGGGPITASLGEGGMGGLIKVSHGGAMMDGGGQFTASPGEGGMGGLVNVSHGGVMMGGGSQFGPFSVTSTRAAGASGQAFQFNGSPNGGGPGGQFGGRWGR